MGSTAASGKSIPHMSLGKSSTGFRVCVATTVDITGILRAGGSAMPNFYEYNPEQGYLLPPNVHEVLGEEHLCFFVHEAVEKLDLREMESRYSEEGHPAYHPALDRKSTR